MRYFHSVDSLLLNNDFKDYLDEFSDFIGESREDGKTITDFFLNDAVHPSELAPFLLRLPDTWHTPKYEWLLEVRREVIEENDIQIKRLFNRSVIETISNDEYETDSLALQEMYDRAGGFEHTRLEFILDDESLRDDILDDLLKASSRISPVIIDMAKINHDDYRAKWDKVSQHLKKAIIANELSI